MKPFIIAIFSLFLSTYSLASDEASFERGKVLSEHCMGCHGEFGIAPIDTNPNLAGQNAKYIEYALKAYRDGVRKGGMAFIMQANAGSLSDKDIKDLAAYFSSQPGRSASTSN